MTITTTAAVSLDNPKIGDLLGVDHAKCYGKTYRVTKVNPTTVVLTEVVADGQIPGRPTKAHRSLLTFAPVSGRNGATAVEVPFDSTPMPVLGAVVTHARKTGAFVIVGFTGDKARIARLGGDANRYFRGIRAADLTVLELAEVAAMIAAGQA